MKPNTNNYCSNHFDDWMEVMLTDKCNGKCSWCIEKDGYKPKNEVSWQRIVKSILSVENKKNIILLGGEPSLYPYISDIIKALKDKNKNVYLTTNGYKLQENAIKYIGLTGLNISMHHYNFEKNKEITGIEILDIDLIETIQKLHLNNTKIRLNCNLIKNYIDSLEEIKNYIQYAKYVGADSVRFAELKIDEENFINLAQLFNYEYGLNNDPFINGCNHNAIIDGMEVNFRQMCGLQTNKRIKPENPEQTCHSNVVYYDGVVYSGWQKNKPTKERLENIIHNLYKGNINIDEATEKILKDI